MTDYKVFFSYVRTDDEGIDFIPSLRRQVIQVAKGITGETVEIFLDKESMLAGEEWARSIDDAILGSSIMVYFYSGNYASSDMCRKEFFDFSRAASRKNISGLVIPLLLFGEESLSADSNDEIVEHVRDHNWIDVSEARIEGDDSPAMRRLADKLAKRVLHEMKRADELLVEQDDIQLVSREKSKDSSSDAYFEQPASDDDSDIFTLQGEFTKSVDAVVVQAENIRQALEALSSVTDSVKLSSATPAQASKSLVIAAQGFKKPALDIEKTGGTMWKEAKKADNALRGIKYLADQAGSSEIWNALAEATRTSGGEYDQLNEVVEQLDVLLDSMKIPAALSASLRRAIAPAQKGIVHVQDSITLMQSWAELVTVAE